MLFNFFRLFAVDLYQLSFCLALSPQKAIELGVNGLSIPMLCPLELSLIAASFRS